MLVAAGIALGAVGVAYGAHFQGTSGDDEIHVTQSGSNTAALLAGDDEYEGAGGTGGADHVKGGTGEDLILGRAYRDSLRGGPGDDVLDGGGRPDGLYGRAGDDRLIGGAGDDLFRPGKGHDTCVGQRTDFGLPRRCEVVEIVD